MKSILDPSFRYTSSVNTDLTKTFARVRKAQREIEKARIEQREREAEGQRGHLVILAERAKGAK